MVLLEAGPHRTAADFTRWESNAARTTSGGRSGMAMVDGGAGGIVPIFGGRCVGGTTTMNTKVAFRAHDFEFAKWHEASGLVGDGDKPFGAETLGPHYERVERVLGVRERADWPHCVRTHRRRLQEARPRARAGRLLHRRELHEVRVLPAGLPDQRRQEHDEHLYPCGNRRRQAGPPPRVAGRASSAGGAWWQPRGDRRRIRRLGRPPPHDRGGSGGRRGRCPEHPSAPDPLRPPSASGGSPSSDRIGRNLGLHPAAFVFGLFDEVQDAHRVYPITSHCMDFMRDEDGGFVLEASTIQDPIGFATSISDEDGPMWGERWWRRPASIGTGTGSCPRQR